MDGDTADDLAARFEEQASVQQQQQQSLLPPKAKKNKSAGGGGGGAGAGAGGAQKREKDISRALSRLLRHQATNAGIQLDREGYAPLDKVVSSISIFFTPFFFICFPTSTFLASGVLEYVVGLVLVGGENNLSRPASLRVVSSARTSGADESYWA